MKKVLLVALSVTALSQPTLADRYPGDEKFNDILQEVYHEIVSDNIDMDFDRSINDRTHLCSVLVDRHNNNRVTYREGDRDNGRLLTTTTNASFIGVTLTLNDCQQALWFSDGYDSPAGWTAWAGNLTGTWFNDERNFNTQKRSYDPQIFTDPANWLSPVKERGTGSDRRNYDLQSVVFSGRSGNARYGWNMSHPEVAYVWGWDGKDNTDNGGYKGMHVGFTFEKSGAQCIVWATTEEAFLECVKPRFGVKRRTSTGFFGIGQWTIR